MYFLYQGELVDLPLVYDDLVTLWTDLTTHCGVAETVQAVREKCQGEHGCSLYEMSVNLIEHKALLVKVGENIFDLAVSRRVWG